MGLHAPLLEATLKVRMNSQKLRWSFYWYERRVAAENALHLFQVRNVIRSQKNESACLKLLFDGFGKLVIDKPPVPVAPLGPWIRKVDMNCFQAVSREHKRQKIGRFQAHQTKVPQTGSQPFAINFSKSAQQPLHSYKIDRRVKPRILDNKAAITTS